jgi:uncharacterized membrane protein
MSAAKINGLAMAAIGVAHLVRPQLFESISAPAFPENTRQHIYINGGIETALGLGIAAPKTRKAALVGLVGYVAYLGVNAAKNRG